MRKWSVFLVAVLTLGAVTPSLAAMDLAGGAYVGVFDKYLWRGFNLSDSKVVVQPGADLTLVGATLSLWGNYNTDTDKMDEVDITLDYSADLNDLLSMSIGNIYYILRGAENTNEAYLSLAVNTHLSPVLTVYYDWDEADSDGLFFTAAVGHSLAIMDNLNLNFGALVSYNQASDYAVGAYRDWHNYELGISLDYAVTEQITITPSFLYSSGISSAAKNAIDSEVLGGINLAYFF
jgi:hypothetical protein